MFWDYMQVFVIIGLKLWPVTLTGAYIFIKEIKKEGF